MLHKKTYILIILLLFLKISLFSANLNFSSRSSSIVINNANSQLKLSNANKVKGWGEQSIIRNVIYNSSSDWTEGYISGVIIGSGGQNPTTHLILSNSNAIIKNSTNIRTNSNTIIIYDKKITNNSNAILHLDTRVDQYDINIRVNSNAILKNTKDISANSNAILKNSSNIRSNSNAIIKNSSNITANSNVIIIHDQKIYNNSNAILNLNSRVNQHDTDIRVNSNAILKNSSNIRSNSNAIIKNSSNITANSNVIIIHDQKIYNNSNAILNLNSRVNQHDTDIRVNSNAILKNTKDISANSNAIITHDTKITNNSNAILHLDARLNQHDIDIRVNSNAIVKNTKDITTNSNAIVNFTNHFVYYGNGKIIVDGLTLTISSDIEINISRNFSTSSEITKSPPAAAANMSGRGILGSPISLNGGTLISGGDILFSSATTFEAPGGNLEARGYAYLLGGDLVIPDGTDLLFTSSGIIDGQGHNLIFEGISRIKLDNFVTVTFRNIGIHNLKNYSDGTSSICMRDSCRSNLVLEDTKMHLASDFSFTAGRLYIEGDVLITGTSNFNYTTTQVSWIAKNTTLKLDMGVTFSYGPASSDDRNLIKMYDETSKIYLNGCTLASTTTGMTLKNGTLIVDHKNYLENYDTKNGSGRNTSEAITFGDNSSNLNLEVLPGGNIKLLSGRLIYQEIPSVK